MKPNPTPEGLNRVIAAVKAHTDLPWENDVTAANQKIAELWKALRDIREFCIPGMNWTDDIADALLAQAEAALAKAAKVEE